MSPAAKPEAVRDHGRPDHWPILSLLGSKAVLYSAAGALLHDTGIAPPPKHSRQLERAEFDLAQNRSIDHDRLVWEPASREVATFLRTCAQAGAAAGGLLLHPLIGHDIPVEALAMATDREPEAPPFTVLRLPTLRAPGDDARPQHADETPRVFVYFNPLGAELPEGRREAELVQERFSARGADVRFTTRSLGAMELAEHYEWADIIFYFGHGRNVHGAPAVPSPDDWTPFPDHEYFHGRSGHKVVFFAACLEYAGPLPDLAAGTALYPVCRISDRPAPFVMDVTEAWVDGMSLPAAYQRALQLDRERGDIRRLVFRLQGRSPVALATPFR